MLENKHGAFFMPPKQVVHILLQRNDELIVGGLRFVLMHLVDLFIMTRKNNEKEKTVITERIPILRFGKKPILDRTLLISSSMERSIEKQHVSKLSYVTAHPWKS